MCALPTVLVGGGTGFIGQYIGRLLTSGAKRHNLINVSRMPGPKNLSWTDLNQNGLPNNVCAVVNCAGQQFMDFSKRWTPGFKQNVLNSRVGTTKSLAEAINKSEKKPDVFVVITGVGAYEPSQTKTYDENSESIGSDFFSKLVVEWEKAARLVKEPTRLVIIRSGAVLGKEGGMIKNMYLPFFLGLGGPIGCGEQFLPWIHVEDLARLVQFAIDNKNVSGILNGVAPQAIKNKDFTKAFAKALNRPAFFPVPEFVLNLLLDAERAMIMTQGQKVIPKRVIESGFVYKYKDIDSACEALVKSK